MRTLQEPSHNLTFTLQSSRRRKTGWHIHGEWYKITLIMRLPLKQERERVEIE